MTKSKKPASKRKATAELYCPHCKKSLTAIQVLEAAEICWPNQRLIGYDCPNCKEFSHAELSGSDLVLGELDGFPGPSLISQSRCTVPAISVVWSQTAVKIKYGKKQKLVPARD